MTWRIVRPFAVKRGSAAFGTPPVLEWLPLAGHAYATREEALEAATALFGEPPTEAALMSLERVIRLQRMDRVDVTFEEAIDTRDGGPR